MCPNLHHRRVSVLLNSMTQSNPVVDGAYSIEKCRRLILQQMAALFMRTCYVNDRPSEDGFPSNPEVCYQRCKRWRRASWVSFGLSLLCVLALAGAIYSGEEFGLAHTWTQLFASVTVVCFFIVVNYISRHLPGWGPSKSDRASYKAWKSWRKIAVESHIAELAANSLFVVDRPLVQKEAASLFEVKRDVEVIICLAIAAKSRSLRDRLVWMDTSYFVRGHAYADIQNIEQFALYLGISADKLVQAEELVPSCLLQPWGL